MMPLLEKADQPLFYWDRRWFWNRAKRIRWAAVLTALPKAERIMSSQISPAKDEVHAAGMQAIGFLKLSAIVSAGVTPLFVLFYILINSVQQANLAGHRELMLKEMDNRYVIKQLDDIRMSNNDLRITENTAMNKSQE